MLREIKKNTKYGSGFIYIYIYKQLQPTVNNGVGDKSHLIFHVCP